MIKRITIPSIVPFTAGSSAIEHLSRANFLFGANGTGKTTISNLIRNESVNPDSKVLEWESGLPVKTYVYNRHFVSANFDSGRNINGIFTMGEDSVETQKKIDELTKAIEKCESSITSASNQAADTEKEIHDIEEKEADAYWRLKATMSPVFKPAWQGSSGSKAKFREAAMDELAKTADDETVPDKDDLLARADVAFDASITHTELIPDIDASELVKLEDSEILRKKVVGKSDIPIAALINRLENMDWVSKGRQYLKDAEGKCPFCQSNLPEGFEAALGGFFDDTFTDDMNAIALLAQDYDRESASYIDEIEKALQTHAAFIDASALEPKIELLKSTVEGNRRKIADKQKSPSVPIELDATKSIVEDIAALFEKANGKIKTQNAIVENRRSEQQKIKAEIWSLFIHEARSTIEPLNDLLQKANKKLAGLETTMKRAAERLSTLKADLDVAESSRTNVKDTAKAINDLLNQLGFTNFKLDVTEDGVSYQITRANGEPASETLSEGERSFLTFLYFYHLMKGSQETSGTSERRVIVIDDPISSMDANVLFVVSSLVHKLAEDARNQTGIVDQLIVLTHNISFHHEVTYEPKGHMNPKTSYYLVRKTGEESVIEYREQNPISSSYEQLWKEIFSEGCSSLTAQNVARLITETFFETMEDVEPREIIEAMEGNDREIACSFLSWANAGSHILADEETFVNTNETTDTYLRVLENIFTTRGYGKHFQAMKSKFSS